MKSKDYFKKFIYIQITIFFTSLFFTNRDFTLLGAFSGKFAIYTFWIIAILGILQRLKVKNNLLKEIQLFLMNHRRYLGIIMFCFSVIHYMWSKGFSFIINGFPSFIPTYQIFGMISLVLLFPLVLTFNNYSVRKLGKFWKTLHYLVYPIMLLLIFHVSLQDFTYFLSYGVPSIFILFLQIYSHIYFRESKKNKITRNDNYFPLKIQKIEKNTEKAVNITFSIPNNLSKDFIFRAGQHISLSFKIDDKSYYRSYSIYHKPEKNNTISISVKRKYDGLISNYINDNLVEGQEVLVSKPFGDFFDQADITDKTKKIYFVAGGSGITPILSIIEFLLSHNVSPKLHLIYANNDINSILFKEKLEYLEKKYTDKFKITYFLSDDSNENKKLLSNNSNYIFDRISTEYIEKLVDFKDSIFYICAPTHLMQIIKDNLITNNVSKSNMHLEFFGVNPENEILYNQGTIVPEDGKYICIDCGYTQFFKKGDIFPGCPICLAGNDDSEYEFWKKI